MSDVGAGQAGKGNQVAKSEGTRRVARMGTGNIPKLVVEFAIPAILGMIVNGAYNLIDSIFLGHGAGEIGLSAITVATPTMTIFLALAMLIGAGGNSLCALRLGEGKHEEAEHILGNTFSLGVLVSVALAVAAHMPFLLDPLLSFSSATDAVRPYAADFLRIIALGCVFQVVGTGLNNFIRTTGAPNRALVTMLVGAIACTVFNAVFVLWWGLGVAGSAWATVCGQAIACATVLWYFTKTPGVPLRLRWRCMPVQGKLARSIVTLGMASFAVQAGAAVVNFVTNFVLVKYGAIDPIGADNALASIGVVMRVGMFVILPLIGMSIAVQPLLGFNCGAKPVEPRAQDAGCGHDGGHYYGHGHVGFDYGVRSANRGLLRHQRSCVGGFFRLRLACRPDFLADYRPSDRGLQLFPGNGPAYEEHRAFADASDSVLGAAAVHPARSVAGHGAVLGFA